MMKIVQKCLEYFINRYSLAITVLLAVCLVCTGCSISDHQNEEDKLTENTAESQAVTEEVEQSQETEDGYHWLSENVFNYQFDDLDNNGIAEYVQVDWTNEKSDYDAKYTIYWNDEAVYESDEILIFDPGKAEYLDLDCDGEKEIFFPFYPRVNSMPLVEYIVLKQTDNGWKSLEMIHGETKLDNAFPISVTKGGDKWSAVIACENLDKQIVYNVENHYLEVKNEMLNAEEDDIYRDWILRYEREFVDYPAGAICGNVSSWGIWEINSGEYEGKSCLIASHGIQCFDKFDYWGNAKVYFDYDSQGNTRFLDIQFEPQSYGVVETEEERIYEGATPEATYADIVKVYYEVGTYMQEEKDTEKAMVVAGNAYVCDEYLCAIASGEGNPIPVYLLYDLNEDGVEELFVGISFEYKNANDSFTTIYDVYTWKDGSACQLMRGIGYRNGSCTICENGVIRNDYSGSAFDWNTLYQVLPKHGVKLETVDEVASVSDSGDVIYYHGNDLADQATVTSIMEKYQPKELNFTECSLEAINELRR